MSVEKFGRHVTSVLTARLRGPPGFGFKTTVEGDYDMSSKRLRVGQLKDENDAVTVNCFNVNCLQLKQTSKDRTFYDTSKQVIRNLKEPVKKTDAVNKFNIGSQTPVRDKERWNFDTKCVINVIKPKSSNDTVNKEYVEQRIPTRGRDN